MKEGYEVLHEAVKLLPDEAIWTPEERERWLNLIRVAVDYLVQVTEPTEAT